ERAIREGGRATDSPHVCAQDTPTPAPTAVPPPPPSATPTPPSTPTPLPPPTASPTPPPTATPPPPPTARPASPAATATLEVAGVPAALPNTGDPDAPTYCADPDPDWWAFLGRLLCGPGAAPTGSLLRWPDRNLGQLAIRPIDSSRFRNRSSPTA